MLINLRNAMMAGKRLPYDAELEYLESTGTQWIDTGVPFSDSTKVECELLVKNNNSAFGVQEPVQLTRFTSAKAFYRNSRIYNYPTSLNDGIWHTLSFSDKVYVDGTLCHTYDPITWTGQAPMYLFALRMQNGSAGDVFVGAFRWLKIFDNGVLARDFIPVRRGTVGYMYDRVTRKLFGNAGMGDFVLGPDVVPVEYIESHGTEWIDTGVYGSNTTKATLDVQLISPKQRSRGVFGAVTDPSNSLYAYQSGSKLVWKVGFGSYIDTTKNTDTERHNIELDDFNVVIDGETIATFSQIQFTTSHTMTIFTTRSESGGIYQPSSSRCYGSRIWQSNILVRSFRPVRVGTGSTWEGAMMDVLTRRIYRNAGTGAFTYGNDLRYPIPSS